MRSKIEFENTLILTHKNHSFDETLEIFLGMLDWTKEIQLF